MLEREDWPKQLAHECCKILIVYWSENLERVYFFQSKNVFKFTFVQVLPAMQSQRLAQHSGNFQPHFHPPRQLSTVC